MADSKLTDLTEATSIDLSSDWLYAVVGGVSRKIKPETLKKHIADNGSNAVTGTTPYVVTFDATIVSPIIIIDYRDSNGISVDYDRNTQVTGISNTGFTFTPTESGVIRWIAITDV